MAAPAEECSKCGRMATAWCESSTRRKLICKRCDPSEPDRLGGKTVTTGSINQQLAAQGQGPLREECPSRVDVWSLEMSEVWSQVQRAHLYRNDLTGRQKHLCDMAANRAMGVESRVAANVTASDRLIEEALAVDPRLARRSVWQRGEEGEIACPALLAQGDDAAFFHRRRSQITEANGGDPVRVVISTDSSDAKPETAAAFIAAVRIVQQFRPIEVWWQGAWLDDNQRGWVFHVPLVRGDMDYTRLDFCINDTSRDNISFTLMYVRALEVTKCFGWRAGRATQSYLPESAHFVSHTGINPTGDSIAYHAATWLGMEYHASAGYEATYGAKQVIRDDAANARWLAEREAEAPARARAREAERLAAEGKRLASVNRNY